MAGRSPSLRKLRFSSPALSFGSAVRPACSTPCTLALWALFVLGTAALAQEADTSTTGTESPSEQANTEKAATDSEAPPPLREDKPAKPWELSGDGKTAGPDIYLLPGKDGKLRQVLGFSYDEFQRAWQLQDKDRQAAPPLYSLAALDVSGTANQSRAKLEIKFQIVPRTAEWIGVSLQLPNLILQNWELENLSKEECLVFDAQKHSYVVWLKSDSGKPRNLTLSGLLKLNRQSNNYELEINLPHAASSQFVLQIPEPEVSFEASPGIDVSTHITESGNTEVRLTGQASPLRLQWGPPTEQTLAMNTVVKAVGDIKVHVDRFRVHYDATFTIDSYHKPLDRLHLQLPPGVTLTQESLPSHYRIANHDRQSGILDIQLLETPNEPWELHLEAEQLRDEDESALQESLCSVSGFDILEALQQSGTVRLSLDDQLQAYFDLYQDIEQVPIESNQSGLTTPTTVAQFEYARLPWILDVHTVARRKRVSVEPHYKLRITQNQAELLLNFNYQFTGAYTPTVRIKMHGWEVTDDPIESAGVVNLDGIKSELDELLVLPITNPKAERVPIGLVARRDIKMGQLELPLPEPLHAFVLPGQLTVEAEPSLRITRTTNGTRGISIASATNQQNKPANGNSKLFRPESKDALELRTFLADAVLGVKVARREREVSVDIKTKIDVGSETIRVLQQLQYFVKYQPITQLELQIPEQLWDNNSLQVRLDGAELPIGLGIFTEALPADRDDTSTSANATKPANADKTTTSDSIRKLIVSLPRPMQSKFLLEVDYQKECPELANEALTPITLPLVAAKNTTLSNMVSIRTEKTIRATLNQTADQGPWSTSQGEQVSETNSLTFKGTGETNTLPLLMQIDSGEDIELATLELAWLQTWIVGDTQQDRAVFRFQTSQRNIFVQLPFALMQKSVEVLLDGVAVEPERSPSNRLTVAMPSDQEFLNHTLEVRYQRPIELTSWGNLAIKMPRLDSRKNPVHVFWQLILPPDWHVAVPPSSLSGEYWLGWQNYQWGRHPTYYQQDLERLTGATTGPPPASPNQYLYRGFEIPRQVNVLVVKRTWLTLTATLIAFGVGMLVIYTPVIRFRIFWLALSLMLVGLIAFSPVITVFVIQVIFWAGILTILAAVLRQLLVGSRKTFIVLDSSLESASTAVTAAWEPELDSKEIPEGTRAISAQSGGPAS